MKNSPDSPGGKVVAGSAWVRAIPHVARHSQAQSGTDVGNQLIFDLYDLIFQRQFPFFQPTQCQLIGAASGFKHMNCLVQIAVFAFQNREPDPKHVVEVEFRGGIHGWIAIWSCCSANITVIR